MISSGRSEHVHRTPQSKTHAYTAMPSRCPIACRFQCPMEYAPRNGQAAVVKLTGLAGIRRERRGKTPDLQHRVQAPGGAGVSRWRGSAWPFQASRHPANLIRLWAAKYEAGEFDEEAEAADLLRQYEAKIAALERLVGRHALDVEFLKGAQKNRVRPKNGPTFAFAGPSACPSPGDVS